jgi:hypothetical protein
VDGFIVLGSYVQGTCTNVAWILGQKLAALSKLRGPFLTSNRTKQNSTLIIVYTGPKRTCLEELWKDISFCYSNSPTQLGFVLCLKEIAVIAHLYVCSLM